MDTTPTATASDQQSTEPKNAPYKHVYFENLLEKHHSYMYDHDEGPDDESKQWCSRLLKSPLAPPEGTLFSDDGLFKRTCKRIKGENEAKVIHTIAKLIVPSAEELADRGAKPLEVLRETVNACWVNAFPFITSSPTPRPQPDFSVGFREAAFGQEYLRTLTPFIGNPVTDSSWVAPAYNLCFPFLTSEVKCGASALDTADRQNAHSQSVALEGVMTLFRSAERESELHRVILGFSISHNDEDVRIFGHYPMVNGEKGVAYYRYPIAKFDFSPTLQGDSRWTAYNFVRNIYELWVLNHFERICSALDSLKGKMDPLRYDAPESQVPDLVQDPIPELSQQRARDLITPSMRPQDQPFTPEFIAQPDASSLKKTKTR